MCKLTPLVTLILILGTGVKAATIPAPTQWIADPKRSSIYNLDGIGDQELPDQYNMKITSSKFFAYIETTNKLGNWSGGYVAFANGGTGIGKTLAESLSEGRTLGTLDQRSVFWKALGGTQPPSCVYYRIFVAADNQGHPGGGIWTSGCVPIQVVDPNVCRIVSPSVVLDHGTISGPTDEPAVGEIEIECTHSASGRLTLPGGTDRIPLGGGFSTLATGSGPLGTPMSLPEGTSTIPLTSTLHGVTIGAWSASLPLVIELD